MSSPLPHPLVAIPSTALSAVVVVVSAAATADTVVVVLIVFGRRRCRRAAAAALSRRRHQAAATKLPPPNCRRRNATAKLPPPPLPDCLASCPPPPFFCRQKIASRALFDCCVCVFVFCQRCCRCHRRRCLLSVVHCPPSLSSVVHAATVILLPLPWCTV